MVSRRRFFSDSDRQRFYNAIRGMREACIDVRRTAPINGIDYETAGTLMQRLDDAVEALTGSREALWHKPHGGSAIPDTPLKPVDQLDRGVLDSSPALSKQSRAFVVQEGTIGDRVLQAWELLDPVEH